MGLMENHEHHALSSYRHYETTDHMSLKAVEEFSDLGAGFALAMRDLEIRGAGNILGTQQSGHIAVVGYELYCQLLEEAVRRLKQLPPRASIDVNVDLPGEAYIPRSYVPDMRLKIDLYRRLTRVSSDSELGDFRSELEDRFGAPPPVVESLLSLAELRIAAHRWKIHSLRIEDQYLVLGCTDGSRLGQLKAQAGDCLRIVDDRTAYLPLEKGVTQPGQLLGRVKSLLRSR